MAEKLLVYHLQSGWVNIILYSFQNIGVSLCILNIVKVYKGTYGSFVLSSYRGNRGCMMSD